MNKWINAFLQDVLKTEKKWVEFGQILVEGTHVECAQEPLRNTHTDFIYWLSFHQEVFEPYTWFLSVQQSHDDIHQSYSVLYLETMRIYKPKKLEELIISFTDLEKELEHFETLLETINKDIHSLPKKTIKEIGKQLRNGESLQATTQIREEILSYANMPDQSVENKATTDDSNMKTIDIHTDNILEDNDTSTEPPITALIDDHASLDQAIEKVRQLKIENNTSGDITHATQWASNIEQTISLKEKSIEQLKKEQELLQLELTNLEERQILNKQGIEQVEQTYQLKQQEVDQENLENNQLIEFKIENKDKLNQEIQALKEQKTGLATFIQELEKEHEEDSLMHSEDIVHNAIENQLEELKQNKMRGIEQLLQHLNLRKIDLKKHKEQLTLLEQEVELMEDELAKKQGDLTDIDEKEQIKNDEKIEKQSEKEKTIQSRLEVINEKQDELFSLIEESNTKKNELSVVDFQIEELKKNNQLIADANQASLKDIEKQQHIKEEKRQGIEQLKTLKLEESNDLSKKIEHAQERLLELRDDLESTQLEHT